MERPTGVALTNINAQLVLPVSTLMNMLSIYLPNAKSPHVDPGRDAIVIAYSDLRYAPINDGEILRAIYLHQIPGAERIYGK